VPKNMLYKYVTIRTLKMVLNGTIRFTQPGAFNDPFELLPEMVVHKNHEEENVNFTFDMLSNRRNPAVGSVFSVSDDHVSSDIDFRNIVKQLNKSIGILCLSKSANSVLMWSHYADQYRGAVIGFDADHEFFTGQIEMEYSEERPKKDVTIYGSGPIPIAELCAKSIDWKYEQEVRIVRALKDCNKAKKGDDGDFSVFTMRVPRECIATVSLGERTPVMSQREIYDLVRNTEIGLSLSAVDNNGYLFRQEIVKFSGPGSEKIGPMVSPRTAHIFSHLKTDFGEMARWMIEKHPASKIANNKA
jgi:hypothetical protein